MNRHRHRYRHRHNRHRQNLRRPRPHNSHWLENYSQGGIGMAADTAPAAYDIEFVSINGTLITTISFEGLERNGTTVKCLAHMMEHGACPGVLAARTDENGWWMEQFVFLCEHSRMAPYDRVLDYYRTTRYVRVDRRMTLVKVLVNEHLRNYANG